MVKLPDICLRRFLAMQKVSLQIGISMLTGMYIMLSLIIIMVNGTEFSHNFSKCHYLLVAITVFILFTWLLAFFGAYLSSITVIRYVLVFWTIFIITWITLVIIRLSKGDKTFCVANQMRCAPTMWIFENGGNISKTAMSTTQMSPTMTTTTTNTALAKSNDVRNSSESYIMEINEVFATTSTVQPVVVDLASLSSNVIERTEESEIVVTTSEKYVMNDDTVLAITTPNDLSTRRKGHAVRIYQKDHHAAWDESVTTMEVNGSLYNGKSQFADMGKQKYDSLPSDDYYDYYEAEEYVDVFTTENQPPEKYYKYVLTITYFLVLFVYSWFVLLSYLVELECIKNCTCHERHGPVQL